MSNDRHPLCSCQPAYEYGGWADPACFACAAVERGWVYKDTVTAMRSEIEMLRAQLAEATTDLLVERAASATLDGRVNHFADEVDRLEAQLAEANDGVEAGRRAAVAAQELTAALLEIGRVVGSDDEAPVVGVRRVVAQLAEAKGLRLGRPLTLTDLDSHGGDAGRWLVPVRGPDWTQVRGSVLRHCLRGAPVEDAIPLDASGNPCPIGGWARVTP